MNKHEHEAFLALGDSHHGSRLRYSEARSFIEASEGTLLLGYTLEGYSFHVYLKNSLIHRIIYNNDQRIIDHISGDDLPLIDLNPDKRIYPEATSYHLICALKGADCCPVMTTFHERLDSRDWHGLTYESLSGK